MRVLILFSSAVVVALAACAAALVNGPPALRILLGLVAVLFLPGYALAVVAFPTRRDLDWVSRTAMSLALSLALGLSALVPTRIPFDAAYNRLIARPRGFPPLGPAPPPRRFAAGTAATLMLAITAALLLGADTTAWVLQGIMTAAVLTVVFGRFCEGAAVYHLLVRAADRARGPAGLGPAPR